MDNARSLLSRSLWHCYTSNRSYYLSVAASLRLTLFRDCSAPMYILDEIDAALDLSHSASRSPLAFVSGILAEPSTDSLSYSAENIGRLFRTRFKGSQFIVVSLKDGLFANANVLFRTRFRDGTSIVEVGHLPFFSSPHRC